MTKIIIESYIKPLNRGFIKMAGDNKLEFIIVGGAAVAYYGCRPADEVDDLDLMVNPTLDNEKNLICLFKAQGIDSTEVRIAGPKFRQIKVKSTFYLDILTPPTEDINFTELLQRSEKSQVGYCEVKVISCIDLISLIRIALELEIGNVDAEKNIEKMKKLSRDLSCLNEYTRAHNTT